MVTFVIGFVHADEGTDDAKSLSSSSAPEKGIIDVYCYRQFRHATIASIQLGDRCELNILNFFI